jgi:Domain of unknown function (DUF4129)
MSPPLIPDADEARRQLADELANPIYADVQNWISDQFRKLLDWLVGDPSPAGSLSSGQLTALVITLVGLAAVAIWLSTGGLRAEHRLRGAVFADEERTADQLRTDAARLAAADEWASATVELFRALIRSLGERAIIEEFGGMTAHEAAAQAAPRLPGLADPITAAADVFDALAYGHRSGSARQYQEMLDLDAEVARTRPVLPAEVADGPSAVVVESVR